MPSTPTQAATMNTAQWSTSSYPPSPGTPHESFNDNDPSSTAASSVYLPSIEDGRAARPRRKHQQQHDGQPSARRFATQCATVDDPSSDMHDQHNASSVPIYMTATFKGSAGAGKYDCEFAPCTQHDLGELGTGSPIVRLTILACCTTLQTLAPVTLQEAS